MILERLRDGAPMFSTMEAQGRCKPEKTLSHEMKLLSHRGDCSFAAAEVQMCVSNCSNMTLINALLPNARFA